MNCQGACELSTSAGSLLHLWPNHTVRLFFLAGIYVFFHACTERLAKSSGRHSKLTARQASVSSGLLAASALEAEPPEHDSKANEQA